MSGSPTPIAVDHTLARAGVVVLLAATAWNIGVDVRELLGASAAEDITSARAPVLLALRTGFLMAAGAAVLALRGRIPAGWRATVVVACAVLVASVLADLVGVLATFGVLSDPTHMLGEENDVHRRLFRLGAMASRAVPLLALLAACERALRPQPAAPIAPAPLASLLLRIEPAMFAIGAGTLSLLLVLSAFVHKEIAWALPVGSDTTLLGCAAACVRARRRADRLAFAGWLTVSLSMGAGLLMGLYAFGGPLPEPALIGSYDSLARVLLRDVHVLAIVGALAALTAATFRPRSSP